MNSLLAVSEDPFELDVEIVLARRRRTVRRTGSGTGFLLALVILVLPEGFFELVLKDVDPAGGFQSRAPAKSSGDAE